MDFDEFLTYASPFTDRIRIKIEFYRKWKFCTLKKGFNCMKDENAYREILYLSLKKYALGTETRVYDAERRAWMLQMLKS